MSDVEMLTVREIASRLGLSKMTIYRLVDAGTIPAVRVGRSLRVSREDFESYLGRVRTSATARD